MNLKPHHIALTVNDLDQSIDWYKEKFGFELTHRYAKNDMEIAHIQRDEVRLELFYFKNEVKSLPDYRKNLIDDLHVVGTKHLCMAVENLQKSIDELRDKGVDFVTELDTAGFGGRYIFFKDCNGILFELYQA